MRERRSKWSKLTLLEGEEILESISHHFLAGVAALVIPVAILLIFTGLFFYGATGGGFTIAASGDAGRLDLASIMLLVLVGFIGALWVLLGVAEHDGYQGRRWGLLGMALLVLVLVTYRFAGGRLFVYDPGQAQPFNPINLLLLLGAIAAFFVCLYLLVDLINDQLILTNMRVIYYNGATLIPRLIEKQVQQDMMLEDIQNVSSRTATYLQHWLNYGTIVVQAANAGAPISFRAAENAREMQRRIMTERRRLLQQQSERNFGALVATRVYQEQTPAPPRGYGYSVLVMPRFLRWALENNPKLDPGQGTITWTPHWIFLVQALGWPLGSMAVVGALLWILGALELVSTALLVVAGLIALVGCLLWAFYQLEDYRNDRYMLTPTALVDIDKKPFGPESRRSANLRTTFVSSLLGYGDVVATTAGSGGAFTFYKVPRPHEVAATINQYISLYRKSERDRSLDEALNLLRSLHETQQRLGELRAGAEPAPPA